MLTLIVILTVVAGKHTHKKTRLHKYKKDPARQFANNQVATSNQLSLALSNTNPTQKLTYLEFLRKLQNPRFNLMRSEIEHIFRLIDRDNDGFITRFDWDGFILLFVAPFEKCDASKDNLLNKAEFDNCLKTDTKLSIITPPNSEAEKTWAEDIYTIANSQGYTANRGDEESMNFYDYIFIRRANLGWRKCGNGGKMIARTNFQCALQAAVTSKTIDRVDSGVVHDVGLGLTNIRYAIFLDYIGFLRIADIWRTYAIFDKPAQNGWIYKEEFLKAQHENRLPNRYSVDGIEGMFDNTIPGPNTKPTLSFESFANFDFWLKMFYKYSKTKRLWLSKSEYMQYTGDSLTPWWFLKHVDRSHTQLGKDILTEAMHMKITSKYTERQYLIRFSENKGRSKHKKFLKSRLHHKKLHHRQIPDKYEYQRNDKSRETSFTIMDFNADGYLTVTEFLELMQLAKAFVLVDKDDIGYLTVYDIVEHVPVNAQPPLSFAKRNDFIIFKKIDLDRKLNILEFMMIMVLRRRASIFGKTRNAETITEIELKVLLKNFGMLNMPDPVLYQATASYDSIKQKTYFWEWAVTRAVEIESIANEILNSRTIVQENGITLANDLSTESNPYSVDDE